MTEIFTGAQPLVGGEIDPEAFHDRIDALDKSDVVDRVLIGYSSVWPHNHAVVPYALGRTSRFSPILAHRPGVMPPTAAARYFASLDVVSRGRLAINVVVGGSDKDLQREGDSLPKADRYRRATEYLDVVRRSWTSAEPFDHEGEFYSASGVSLQTRPYQGQVPIFMGGDSDDAVEFGAKHADLYMLWGEPLAGTEERIKRVNRAAEEHQRNMRYSINLRLFVAETDDQAWQLARAAEHEISEAQGTNRFLRSSKGDTSVGRQRALALTDEELHDDCFWTGLTKLLGGFANSQALVGSYDRVYSTLKSYRELGIDAFLFTTGVEAAWDPSIEEFVSEVKKGL
ncbi:LLM class flavin-dependent oxidoreductase [Brevibacterium oceani]|uniref:LLM class flavin-dependent oxidoreductase n=1 Tax=Brevibacterium oceani TaxID=358099 RepID=UPI001B33088D|nr:LLM class flavin-dependent oxidoreductase [Brevibacterium oceani]